MSSEGKLADSAAEDKPSEPSILKNETLAIPSLEHAGGPKSIPKPDEVLETHAETVPPKPTKLSPLEIVQIFKSIDKSSTFEVPTEQFIAALKSSPDAAEKFGMEKDFQKEDALKDSYVLAFGKFDRKSTKSITVRFRHLRVDFHTLRLEHSNQQRGYTS